MKKSEVPFDHDPKCDVDPKTLTWNKTKRPVTDGKLFMCPSCKARIKAKRDLKK
jgi:uncharacterized protein YlaI